MSITPSELVLALKLLDRHNSPIFVIDNDSCEDFTIITIKVESYNNHGILRQVVGLFSEMNIVITNVYMFWDDGRRSPMEVLNVTDSYGNKITNEQVIGYIKKGLEAVKDGDYPLNCYVGEFDRDEHSETYCSIELTRTDKRGLCKVRGSLFGLDCELLKAKICSHISQMFAILRAMSRVKQSSCQYLSLKPAQDTTASFLCMTLFERPIPPNPKMMVMSSMIPKKVRVMHLPSVNGKGSKISRIK